MKSPLPASALLCLCISVARGQSYNGTGDFSWEASSDGGNTWIRQHLLVGPEVEAVIVRAMVSWDVVPYSGFAFGASKFDVLIENAGPGDAVDSFDKDVYFGYRQTLSSSRFEGALKIDERGDLLAPGEGAAGVWPGQITPQFPYDIDTRNPAPVFSFRLVPDGTPGTRRVRTFYYVPNAGGNTVDRFMYTWVQHGTSLYNLPLMTIHELGIEFETECEADFDSNGQLDFFDYLDFIAAFAAADPAADFDGNGQIDFLDYLDFIAAFDSGCE
jgi:hypothetical protein